MENKKTLVIDCDGVLYPLSAIPTKKFLQAFRESIFHLGITTEQYEQASILTKSKKALGLFNFAKEICSDYSVDFDLLCKEFISRLDYSAISKDEELWTLLERAKKQYNLAIYTNNHILQF